MQGNQLKEFCSLDHEGETVLKKAVDILGLSARACHNVMRVARTIADLEASENIRKKHLAEAVQLRSFDRGLSQPMDGR